MSDPSSQFIEIPDQARVAKNWFSEPPSEALITEIKQFVAESGEPWLWRGHTHTKPPVGALVQYAGRFDIPKANRERKLWVPCPCCSPEHRKFGEGLIAWFPDEQVIRLIGPDCFKAINEAGHENAYADLVKRENERKELDYIARCLDRMPQWLATAAELVDVAHAADEFFPLLENRLSKSLRVPIWREIKTGGLYIVEQIALPTLDKGGSLYMQNKGTRVQVAVIEGFRALSPSRKPLYPQLKAGLDGLQAAGHLSQDAVTKLPPVERLAISRELRRSLQLLKRLGVDLQDQLRLLSQVNVNRIRQWASNPHSQVDFQISRVGGTILLSGRKDYRYEGATEYRLEIPEQLRTLLLPSFKDIDV